MANEQTPMAALESGLERVTRAANALRIGEIVAIDAGPDAPSLMLLAAETASPAMLAQLAAFGPAVAVVAAARAGRTPDGPVVIGGPITAATLRTLADPVLPQLVAMDAIPASPGDAPGYAAALALLKRARLLPAAAIVAGHAPGLPAVSRADIEGYASDSALALARISEAVVPLARMADCRLVTFRAGATGLDHLAILLGRPEAMAAPLVRVHSECFTGDLLGSLRCDCGTQLQGALDRMVAEGGGAVLYLAQEGRGIGLANKLRAYALQDRGLDTLDANRALGFGADERDFAVAAAMLRQLGLVRIRLLTNNPDKIASIGLHGIDVTARVGLRYAPNGVNDAYLATKTERFGHLAGEAGS